MRKALTATTHRWRQGLDRTYDRLLGALEFRGGLAGRETANHRFDFHEKSYRNVKQTCCADTTVLILLIDQATLALPCGGSQFRADSIVNKNFRISNITLKDDLSPSATATYVATLR
jgi:hypothetical protein